MPVADPNWSNFPSTVYPGGRQTLGTPIHTTEDPVLTVHINQLVGKDLSTNQPDPITSNKGGLSVSETGYAPDVVNMFYYIRETDVSTYTTKFVAGSEGKVKKIVTYKKGAIAGDMAQVSIFLYQATPLPTKITTIYVYEEDVSYYIDGSGPAYDYNSSTQNNIIPN